MKDHRSAAGGTQLLGGPLAAARLADRGAAIEGADLIGTDDDGLRVPGLHGIGLECRQPAGEGGRRLAGQRGLVDVGAVGLERQLQPGEQFAAIRGRRSQNQFHGLL